MSPSLSPHLSSFPLPKRESWLVPVAKGFSFVLSRRFQLIFIVCLLGQSSVIFDETPLRTVPLLFIIVVSRGTPSLPPRGRVNDSSVTNRPVQLEFRHCISATKHTDIKISLFIYISRLHVSEASYAIFQRSTRKQGCTRRLYRTSSTMISP